MSRSPVACEVGHEVHAIVGGKDGRGTVVAVGPNGPMVEFAAKPYPETLVCPTGTYFMGHSAIVHNYTTGTGCFAEVSD